MNYAERRALVAARGAQTPSSQPGTWQGAQDALARAWRHLAGRIDGVRVEPDPLGPEWRAAWRRERAAWEERNRATLGAEEIGVWARRLRPWAQEFGARTDEPAIGAMTRRQLQTELDRLHAAWRSLKRDVDAVPRDVPATRTVAEVQRLLRARGVEPSGPSGEATIEAIRTFAAGLESFPADPGAEWEASISADGGHIEIGPAMWAALNGRSWTPSPLSDVWRSHFAAAFLRYRQWMDRLMEASGLERWVYSDETETELRGQRTELARYRDEYQELTGRAPSGALPAERPEEEPSRWGDFLGGALTGGGATVALGIGLLVLLAAARR